MIKIIIADDHAIVRRGMKQMLASEADMELVAEAENGAQALRFAREFPCDVLVLDISMPGRSGIDVVKEVKRECPQLAVLMLTMYPQEQYAVRALKAGASGYLTKDSATDELIQAIRRVAAGGKYINTALAESLVNHLASKSDLPLHENLSDREFEVLCKLGMGKTVGEIAEELFLSTNTISTYRARLLEKLNLRNNAELMHYAIMHCLTGAEVARARQ